MLLVWGISFILGSFLVSALAEQWGISIRNRQTKGIIVWGIFFLASALILGFVTTILVMEITNAS